MEGGRKGGPLGAGDESSFYLFIFASGIFYALDIAGAQ